MSSTSTIKNHNLPLAHHWSFLNANGVFSYQCMHILQLVTQAVNFYDSQCSIQSSKKLPIECNQVNKTWGNKKNFLSEVITFVPIYFTIYLWSTKNQKVRSLRLIMMIPVVFWKMKSIFTSIRRKMLKQQIINTIYFNRMPGNLHRTEGYSHSMFQHRRFETYFKA